MKKVIASTRGSYAEIFQNKNVKFSCAIEQKDGTIKELHTPFVCRDFLAEVLYGEKFNKRAAIYGFCFDGTKEKWEERPHLLVRYTDISLFEKHLNLLHYYEEIMGLEPSELHKTDKKYCVLFIGDPAWKRSCWMISFYTLLIRMMAYDNYVDNPETAILEVSKLSGNDANYCKELLGVQLNTIAKEWKKIHEGADIDGRAPGTDKEVSFMHNSCGIVGLARQIKQNNAQSVWVKNYKELIA